MSTGPISHGTVLAGRYRLEDLLAEREGAWFWRATDTILARSVAVHAVPSEDPRAPGLLEAARLSATVTDTHLLRVLDCDDEDGITWVVNEWGEGISLDLMLQHGPLPPDRAAWVAREVAQAITSGHAQGVAHGRLNPESVLVTHAGAVKLIGYVVDASLQAPAPPDPLYGEVDAREADVINLAGILYASLTGRWPGVTRSAVPPAPREGRRPLRPRQVRAGVPRTLDAICDRVLHKEASLHALPIETAHEIAAALADYIGDPAQVAPLAASSAHDETAGADVAPLLHATTRPANPPETQADNQADTQAVFVADFRADLRADSSQADPQATGVVVLPALPTGRADEDAEATPIASPAPDPSSTRDPEATQHFQVPGSDADTPPRPRADRHSPLPPFPDLPERPLFASTERRVPEAARRAAQEAAAQEAAREAAGLASPASTGATGSFRRQDTSAGSRGVHDTPPGNPPPDFWPFVGPEEESEAHTGKEGRGWLRTAVVVGLLLVIVVVAAVAINRTRSDSTPSASSGDSQGSSVRAQGGAVKLAGARDFDPAGEPAEENPETARNAADGDPATTWQTMTYRGDPALGGLKPGVGVIVDLGRDQEPRAVTVQLKGAPTSFEVYAASAGVTEPPESLDQLDRVAARADAPERTTVELNPRPQTRYLLVWLTRLPEVSGGFRGEIVDIAVRS